MAGQVVGVAAAINLADRATNFAIPTEHVRSFLALRSGASSDQVATVVRDSGVRVWMVGAALGVGLVAGRQLRMSPIRRWLQRRAPPHPDDSVVVVLHPQEPSDVENLGADDLVLVGHARPLIGSQPETLPTPVDPASDRSQ